MTDRTTQMLAAYASQLGYADLSAAAIHAAKRSLIDSIGCAFGAFHAEPVRALRRLAGRASAVQPATVIGTEIRSTPELAAFANAAMVRYLDFSDDYFGGRGDVGPHPSDNICSVMAAAESVGADGRALLLGIAVAYEACGQIAEKIDFKGVKPTWDYTTLHAIASALGAANVWHLPYEQTRNALALAATANIGLLQTRTGELSHWKGLAGPYGSRNGLFAAMLAREGITGPDDPLEGKAGWMKHLNMPFRIEALGGGATPFKIESTFYKYMPVRYAVQLAIWTALELRQTVAFDEIASIRVFVVKRYVTSRASEPEAWAPTTRETTDHSFPYLIAAALVDGEISERTFTAERFRDPIILALADKIEMAEDPAYTAAFPRTFNCRLEVALRSGEARHVHQTNPKGHPANPMSDREIEEKFERQADTVRLPGAQVRAILDRLWTVDEQKDTSALFALLRVTES
jgi:2-methylcitrate dehydratase